MYKFLYQNKDVNRNQPYPNGWHHEVINYYDNNNENYDYNESSQKFLLHTCHSELYYNLVDDFPEKIIFLDEIQNNDSNFFLLYPLELYGNHNRLLLENNFLSKTNKEYTTSFVKNISQKIIELAKLRKIKFVINYSHEPFSDLDFIKKFKNEIVEIGLNPEYFIFFVGTSNLYELLPEIKNYGFKFFFENSIITTTARKIENLKYNNNYTLGYETKWIDDNDNGIYNLRNKHFICLNRNFNKNHRFTLGCFFEHTKLWDKLYASFLNNNHNQKMFFKTDNYDFDLNIELAADEFIKKTPIEVDTENSIDKQSFEVAKAFKRELYLDSYINIVTETNFEKDIFITEKIINPIAVLQPFILFGAYNYLKYFRSIGFKTFNGFINEDYDNEFDDKKRYLMVCEEIKRISDLPLENLHKWYLSILDILIYNRNHLCTFSNKKMFESNLNKNLFLYE